MYFNMVQALVKDNLGRGARVDTCPNCANDMAVLQHGTPLHAHNFSRFAADYIMGWRSSSKEPAKLGGFKFDRAACSDQRFKMVACRLTAAERLYAANPGLKKDLWAAVAKRKAEYAAAH